ncbi:hypothetical protein H4S02_013626 [Coemansia sp. RSA 2611]|nr:hypothetical protein H4S02_013626 [Coemansia sp. RSA 2611]
MGMDMDMDMGMDTAMAIAMAMITTTTTYTRAKPSNFIHTEFRYVNGFKPFQFNAPGSCLEPLGSDKQ